MIALTALLLLSGMADTPQGPKQKKAAPEPKMLYKVAPRDDASRTLQKYSECLVETQKPARLSAYLSIPPEAPEFGSESAKLATSRCAPSRGNDYTIRFQPNVLRAALYDALYRVRFRLNPTDISAVPALDVSKEFSASPSGATVMFRGIGDCIARAHPAEVRALLMTREASNDEKAAMAPLKPAFGSCVPSGTKITFSREMLRGMLAEAMYKLSLAARSAPAGGK